MKNRDVYNFIDKIMPFSSAMSFDNVGLLVGSMEQEVESVLVCLDITSKVIEEAKSIGANLIVSHHPVIFHALKSIDSNSVVYKLIQNGMSAICAHTNFDMCESLSVNHAFASAAGLSQIELAQSKEYFVAQLAREFTTQDFAMLIKSHMLDTTVNYTNIDKNIKKIAICSGAGSDAFCELSEDIDALVSGEIKHNIWIDSVEKNIPIFSIGHYESEKYCVKYMAKYLSENLGELSVAESKNEKNPVKQL